MPGKKLKLHLGCGKRNFGPDWIHIDGEKKYDHVTYHDITELPYANNTVDLIYTCHVFECFDREEGFEVLKEWHRVLKPGSILRIAVPDFKAISNLYTNTIWKQGKSALKNFLGPLYGKMKMNNEYIYHKTIYDEEDLKHIMQMAGFVNVKLYDWRKTEHAHCDDFSQAYIPHMDKEKGTLISLNMEGIKP